MVESKWRRLRTIPVALLLALSSAGSAFTPVMAATSVTQVDFTQCANDPVPSAATNCPGGWINGILQGSNSHYAEDLVVPQRIVVDVPGTLTGATTHTLTVRYQARKASTHAYDSIATWNYTQTGADRCQSLATGTCPTGSASTFAIPFDCTEVPAATLPGTAQGGCSSSANDVTARHQLAGQVATMYGGALTDITAPVHDSAAAPGTDDYATVTFSYTVAASTAADNYVELLFGGHLAAGLRSRGWGVGLGASSINGGPYHFKWDLSDGASIGNRDNQISAGGIMAAPTVSTLLSASSVGAGTPVTDSATLIGAASNAGGTVTYNVFAGNVCTGTPVFTSTVTVTGAVVPPSAPFNTALAPAAPGSYQWQASYSGDANDLPAVSDCGTEPLTISKASPTITTQASPTSILVGTANTVGDTATFANTGLAAPTGSVTFTLYSNNTCATSTGVTGSGVISTTGGVSIASFSTSWTPTNKGSYYWIASYAGDGNDNAFTTTCGDSNEVLVVSANSPTLTTLANPTSATVGAASSVGDTATFHGTTSVAPTGSGTFTLYSNGTCTTSTGVTGSGVISTTGGVSTASFSTSWTPPATGTYHWVASYAGDFNNNGFTTGCGDANEQLTVGKVSPTITTQAAPTSIPVGTATTVGDGATFHGTTSVAPTGSVTFTLYSNNTCTTSTGITGSGAISTTGGVSSASFSKSWTAPAAGTFYWIASYAGDSNNNGFTTGCGDANEQLVVGMVSPTITTSASPSAITVGTTSTVGDSATFHGTTSVAPTGSVTFTLYSNNTCTAATGVTGSGTISTTGGVSTATFSTSWTAPATGTYYWTASYAGDGNNNGFTSGCGDAGELVVVGPGSPTITTLANPTSTTVGTATVVGDTAVFGNTTSVAPTGSVSFTLYSNASCTTSTGITGSGTITTAGGVSSATFSKSWTAPAAGVYNWIASYSGDSNNNGFTTFCGDANEELSVSPASPTITTQAAPTSVTVGTATTVGDTATFHDTTSVAPTGSVTFALFSDGACTTPTSVGGSSPISTAGGVSTATFSSSWTAPGTGTYHWTASYAGDSNNNGFSTGCGDAGEQLTVNAGSPTITTQAAPTTITYGAASTVGDTATFHSTTSVAPTGNVTFTLYSDATCETSTGVTGNGAISTTGGVSSASFSKSWTPPAAGTYSWLARYAGDANNDGFTTGCSDSNEQLTVSKTAAAITTTPNVTSGTVGIAIHDVANVTAASTTPTGTVTFALYAPDDTTCATNLLASNSSFKVALANGSATSPDFTTTDIGIYQWVASYSGDANHLASAGTCGDATEQVVTGAVLAEVSLPNTGSVYLTLFVLGLPLMFIGLLLLFLGRPRRRRGNEA